MTRAFLTALLVLAALPASAQQLSLRSTTDWSRCPRGGTGAPGPGRVGPRRRHPRGRRRADRRAAADAHARERARGQGPRHHPARRRRLRRRDAGRARQRRRRATTGFWCWPPVRRPRRAPATAAARPAGRSTRRGRSRRKCRRAEPVNDIADMPMPDPAQNPFAAAFAQPAMASRDDAAFGQPGQPVPFGQPQQGMPFGQQPGQGCPSAQPSSANPFGVPMAQPNGSGVFVPIEPPAPTRRPQGSSARSARATPGDGSSPSSRDSSSRGPAQD